MKGEGRLKLLEFIGELARSVDDLFFIFSLPYGTSYGKAKFLLDKKHRAQEKLEIKRGERQRFYDLLYHLRKEGLVAKTQTPNGSFLELTAKGSNYLKIANIKRTQMLPINRYEYQNDNLLKIVIFDIPESEKRKRAWLRAALKNLEFSMLQKSVWAGKATLPEQFIADLRRLRLIPYVEIFEITRAGSLRQIKS